MSTIFGRFRMRGLPTLSQTIWSNLPLMTIAAVYFAVAALLLDDVAHDLALADVLPIANIGVFGIFVLGVSVITILIWLMLPGAESGAERLGRWLRETPFIEILLVRMTLPLILLSCIKTTYVLIKPQIPELQPFQWDAFFTELDRLLLFGADAWHVTHALFSTPALTGLLDTIYILWFYILVLGQVFIAALPMQSRLRLTYLLTVAIGWCVPGTLLAIIFSSAGPVYVEALYGDPVFAPLLAELEAQNRAVPLHALYAHELLWQGYIGPEAFPFGISAFPSLHVYMIAVVWAASFHGPRWLSITLGLMTLLMLIGSVHLAWHYVVDGLASLALVWLIWRGCWIFSGRWLAKMPAVGPDPVEQDPVTQTA